MNFGHNLVIFHYNNVWSVYQEKMLKSAVSVKSFQQIDFRMCGANAGTGNLLQCVVLSVKGTEQ